MTVCAKETFAFYAPDGAQVVIHRGKPFPDGHPYVKGREHLFEPVDVVAARSAALSGVKLGAAAAVETATAAPGEARHVTRSPSTSAKPSTGTSTKPKD